MKNSEVIASSIVREGEKQQKLGTCSMQIPFYSFRWNKDNKNYQKEEGRGSNEEFFAPNSLLFRCRDETCGYLGRG